MYRLYQTNYKIEQLKSEKETIRNEMIQEAIDEYSKLIMEHSSQIENLLKGFVADIKMIYEVK